METLGGLLTSRRRRRFRPISRWLVRARASGRATYAKCARNRRHLRV